MCKSCPVGRKKYDANSIDDNFDLSDMAYFIKNIVKHDSSIPELKVNIDKECKLRFENFIRYIEKGVV